ncbi:MAG: hypothetical protein V1924_02195 [Candidatus Bathyarchaeota archaeon]
MQRQLLERPRVGESSMHFFLKQVGRLFLLNQGCHTVETEVRLNQLGLQRLDELDNKKIVDVLGVGLRHKPYSRMVQRENCEDFTLPQPNLYDVGVNVIRGVEVKVSRGDFRNGFICAGCNYNYVLTPTRLVSPGLLPRGVGLIEYNRYKFSCEPSDDPERRPYRISGLRVIRKAQYRELPRFQVDHAIATIAERRLSEAQRAALAEVLTSLDDPELVYQAP